VLGASRPMAAGDEGWEVVSLWQSFCFQPDRSLESQLAELWKSAFAGSRFLTLPDAARPDRYRAARKPVPQDIRRRGG
jgi:hypothetical protein